MAEDLGAKYDVITYGHGDVTTQANIKKIAEEEERNGKPISNQQDGACRYKDLSEGYQLRQFPPYYFWRVFKDGTPLSLGDFTHIAAAETAANNHNIKD